MVNQIEQFYASNHHPSVIRVCPLAHSSLITILQQRAYVLSSFAYRWVLDFESWDSPFEEADERVRVARSDEELMWARTVSSGFSDMETVPEGCDLHLDRAFFRMPGAIPVLSVVNDQPAAAGVLALNRGRIARDQFEGFECQQICLHIHTSTLPLQHSILANNSVARYDNRNWIGPICQSHSPGSCGMHDT